MKIAICVNGESFKFEKGYYWLKQKFLSKYDCDIYIHTWNNSENLDKILSSYIRVPEKVVDMFRHQYVREVFSVLGMSLAAVFVPSGAVPAFNVGVSNL